MSDSSTELQDSMLNSEEKITEEKKLEQAIQELEEVAASSATQELLSEHILETIQNSSELLNRVVANIESNFKNIDRLHLAISNLRETIEKLNESSGELGSINEIILGLKQLVEVLSLFSTDFKAVKTELNEQTELIKKYIENSQGDRDQNNLIGDLSQKTVNDSQSSSSLNLMSYTTLALAIVNILFITFMLFKK